MLRSRHGNVFRSHDDNLKICLTLPPVDQLSLCRRFPSHQDDRTLREVLCIAIRHYRRHPLGDLEIDTVHVLMRLESTGTAAAAVAAAPTTVLLADMTGIAPRLSASQSPRTRGFFQYVLQHGEGLRFELAVVEFAVFFTTPAAEMVLVTQFVFVFASLIHFPRFWWRSQEDRVESVSVFVDRYEVFCFRRRKWKQI